MCASFVLLGSLSAVVLWPACGFASASSKAILRCDGLDCDSVSFSVDQWIFVVAFERYQNQLSLNVFCDRKGLKS